MSRQREWQRRQDAAGLCLTCGGPRTTKPIKGGDKRMCGRHDFLAYLRARGRLARLRMKTLKEEAMKFRQIGREVEAVQYQPGEKPPEGFAWREVESLVHVSSVKEGLRDCHGKPHAIIEAEQGTLTACPGSYVVLSDGGEVEVMAPADFDMNYVEDGTELGGEA